MTIMMQKIWKCATSGHVGTLLRKGLSVVAPGAYRRGSAGIYELMKPVEYEPEVVGYTIRQTRHVDLLFDGCDRVTAQRRLWLGDCCWCAYSDGVIASILWGHQGSCYVRGMGYHHITTPDSWYLYGAMTAPAHRRKGLFQALVALASQELRAQTTGTITAMVMDDNATSRRVFEGLGYEHAKQISHVTLCWVKRTKVIDDWGIETRVFVSAPTEYVI